ncbi:MAG TPA: polysaccharide deacetylase family protein [Planctomycetaceae bacterium]|nr:polysaccharide deacetylase family protein [Planctomycetaceae bacterium]
MSRKLMLAHALDRSGCGTLLRLTPSWRGVLILNYHRIGEARHSMLDRNLWSATTEEFDQQIRTIVRDFDIIGLDELETALHDRRGRSVMITFDDGYLDNYTEAFPVLKSHRASATFFITTGFLDVPKIPWWDEMAWMVRSCRLPHLPQNPWTGGPVPFDEPDRERAIRRVLNAYKMLEGSSTDEFIEVLAEKLETGRAPAHIGHELWMTWPMIREMSQSRMFFGGHTVNHPILANLTPEAQDFEIGECRRRLMQELKQPVDAFSYPVGGHTSFNQATRDALAKHGYRWAFTYVGGVASQLQLDPFAIQRSAVESDTVRPIFRAMLTLPHFFA